MSDSNREAFEEEVRKHFDPARAAEQLARDDSGTYVEWPVMLAWECWNAAGAITTKPTRSQKLRDAGFTRRDTHLACDECGKKFSAQLLPVHACAARSEPLFLVCAGGDGYLSEIVPASRLDDAYLLTQWSSLDSIDDDQRAEALEHFHDPDEWLHIDPLKGGKDRVPVEFSLALEDGWVRVVRLPHADQNTEAYIAEVMAGPLSDHPVWSDV